jgi:hypothetical protein
MGASPDVARSATVSYQSGILVNDPAPRTVRHASVRWFEQWGGSESIPQDQNLRTRVANGERCLPTVDADRPLSPVVKKAFAL